MAEEPSMADDARGRAPAQDDYGPRALERLDALAWRALGCYSLGGERTLVRINVSENVTYRVELSGRPVAILRSIRHGYNSSAEVESELDWMEALRAEGCVRVPRALPSVDGRRIVDLIDPLQPAAPPRRFVLFELLAGHRPSQDEAMAAFGELGRIAALLHLHGRSWRRPATFVRRSWDVEAILGAAPPWGDWRDATSVGAEERRLLEEVCGVVREELSDYGTSADRFGLVHADLRPENLLLDASGISVLDFDDCGFGWFLFDLATAVVAVAGREDPEVPIRSWLSGYEEVSDLPPHDGVVPSLCMLRRLMVLAWAASHRPRGAAVGRAGAAACQAGERYLARRGGRAGRARHVTTS